ncbi:MAG: nucleoside monophosphate kinase [Planctomycetota bacterium]
MNKRIVLLGAPGSGKGTQGRRLAEQFNMPHLSTGHMLRSMTPTNSQEAELQRHVLSGGFAPDPWIIDCVLDHLSRLKSDPGFILDGFPRTLPQAECLDRWLIEQDLGPCVAVWLDVSASVRLQRLRERRARENRPDDDADSLARRCELDEHQRQPILDHYDRDGRLHQIDGSGTAPLVTEQIVEALSS